ncbi:glutaminase A [Alkalihalobacterium chitinilyticum]|uniref:Glutaminase n=1 Tax=Alkalihalobacterium chitinilyticum TaxID=2980103 RepID=A0ABT5VF83_9BACI|nr:glutaminase A [Alkalihalobacterium chitinilyticum]MDE5413113.1 glutaminase A [Alkalihalobacterium chitinilyticum]
MSCYKQEDLIKMVEEANRLTHKGKVADYIPALGEADPSTLAVAIYTGEQECMYAGNIEERFTLQSISKVLTLALALMDRGTDYVFQRVGMEPTGDPFNSISKLETSVPSKPLNPMINAGALAVTDMLVGNTVEDKLERLLKFIRQLTGNENISYNPVVAQSEFETADLNRSLCYFMRQHGVIESNIEMLINLYTKHCAIEMNCNDLAKLGYIIGNEGRDPNSDQTVIPLEIARIVKTFMVTCGMYNASGEFAIKVGIPAKSGVSGGILGSVPHGVGIGIYGPALDEKGNSIGGLRLLELLSKQYNLSIF